MSAASSHNFIPLPASSPDKAAKSQTCRFLSRIVKLTALWGVGFIVINVSNICSHAQQTAELAENAAPVAEDVGAAVEVDGRPILIIYAHVGGFTSQERAETIQQRIVAVGKNRAIPVDAIHIEDHGSWTEILAGKDRIMGITEADAAEAGRGRAELAVEYTEVIRQVVAQYRDSHTLRNLLKGGIYALLTTATCLLLMWVLFWLRRKLHRRLEAKLHPPDHVGRLGHYLERPLLAIGRIAFWIVVLATLQACGTIVLRFFPSTKYTSYQVTNWLSQSWVRLGGM